MIEFNGVIQCRSFSSDQIDLFPQFFLSLPNIVHPKLLLRTSPSSFTIKASSPSSSPSTTFSESQGIKIKSITTKPIGGQKTGMSGLRKKVIIKITSGNGIGKFWLAIYRTVLAWLSIIAYQNKDKKPGKKLVSVSDVVKEHWAAYGRNFFSRYAFEAWDSDGANKMVEYIKDFVSKSNAERFSILGNCILQFADDFTYADPIDGSTASKQAVWFVFTDGLRIISRLSGTGSAGATVRMYVEQLEPDAS